jgi:hypothetical protein
VLAKASRPKFQASRREICTYRVLDGNATKAAEAILPMHLWPAAQQYHDNVVHRGSRDTKDVEALVKEASPPLDGDSTRSPAFPNAEG